MEYNQLIITDEAKLSLEEKRFVVLHKDIVFCGNSAVEYAVKMARDLKEMRDSKAYKVAGFETFGSYTENALGIKERQAYNYISVLEKLPENFLQSNAKLGITKLVLLSGISESDREEVVASTNVEDITVKELKEKIAQQESKIQQLGIDLDLNTKALYQAKTQADEWHESCKKMESRVNVAVNDQKKKDQADIDRLQSQVKDLSARITALKNAPKEKEVVKDEEELNRLRAELAQKNAELEKANKEVLIASDLSLTKFKIEFENLQILLERISDLLKSMDNDVRARCVSALVSVFGSVSNE